MCETVTAALAAGEPLSEAQVFHVESCPACRGAAAIVAGWRPARLSATAPDVPRASAARARATVTRRRARNGVAIAIMAAALFLWPRPAPAPEPDLFAVLDEADAVLAEDDVDLDTLFEPDFDSFDLGDL